MSSYYFAYGSNMNVQRMQARGLSYTEVLAGSLPGFRLVFNKRAADAPQRSYANIAYEPGAVVEGVLYRLADDVEILKMDPFEGTPRFYSREIFPISTAAGYLPGWVYVANPAMVSDGLQPARWYLEHLLEGKSWLSPDYHARLAQTPCAEGE